MGPCQRDRRLSDRHGAAEPAVAFNPSAARRAARVAKFERDKLIIDRLNHSVSVAVTAARIGIGEKRKRAVIRDPRTKIRGLARRMPRPPEAFVAIQVSRLNEALLMAYNAMSPTNLKAVHEVVKIVRELDRFGGAFAAEWARPEASPRIIPEPQPENPGLDASCKESLAFGGAWVCSADLALQGFDAAAAGHRLENLAQGLEKIESVPGIAKDPLAPLQLGEGWGEGLGRLAADPRQAPHPSLLPVNGEKEPIGARP